MAKFLLLLLVAGLLSTAIWLTYSSSKSEQIDTEVGMAATTTEKIIIEDAAANVSTTNPEPKPTEREVTPETRHTVAGKVRSIAKDHDGKVIAIINNDLELGGVAAGLINVEADQCNIISGKYYALGVIYNQSKDRYTCLSASEIEDGF